MPRDVVERAMAGDHQAFSELARLEVRRLYATARLILRDEISAEDATQEALVAAWRDIGSLRDPDRFERWLHRLLVRECYREASRGRRRMMAEGRVRPITDRAPDPSQQHLVRDQLERGFRSLDVEQRTVLVLHLYLGYSVPEIADALHIPIGTVKSRVHRGALAMRATLDADDAFPALPEGRPA
jgi:RNA polymerase sigma-70 factor, ECF subfamily